MTFSRGHSEVNQTSEAGGYSGLQAAKIVGISYRQLDYWARTDLIRPSIADAHGSGSQRKYSYEDLIRLKLVKRLIDNGLALQGVRRMVESIAKIEGMNLANAGLVFCGGSKSVLARDEENLVDVMRGNQMMFGMVLSLNDIKSELENEIVSISEFRQAAESAAEEPQTSTVAATPS